MDCIQTDVFNMNLEFVDECGGRMTYTKSSDSYECSECGYIFMVGHKAQERVVSVSVVRLCLDTILRPLRTVLRSVKGWLA